MSDAERTPQRFNESPTLRDDQRGLQDVDSSLHMASAVFAHDGGTARGPTARFGEVLASDQTYRQPRPGPLVGQSTLIGHRI